MKAISGKNLLLLAVTLASSVFVVRVAGQSTAPAAPAAKPLAVRQPAHYRPERFSRRAELHYGLIWGVDSLSVKWTEQGEIIRFAYRVLDGNKAQALNDKKA